MDLKTSKRNIIGVLIITVIFAIFSFISISNMMKDGGNKDIIVKSDYIALLEKEYNKEFLDGTDFEILSQINEEVLVVPTKYKYYFEPCFNFVVVSDGVIITKRLAKEFDELGFTEGMKITKVNDVLLEGKNYFEILDLMYAKNYEEEKVFHHTGGEIKYTYKAYNNRFSYNEENNTLHIYNLDNVLRETIHEIYLSNPDLVIDLSMATVNTFEGIEQFVSMFSGDREVLFQTPENIISYTPRKISDVTLVLGENNDDGILFALTAIRSFKANVKIVKNAIDVEEIIVNKTTFNAIKVLSNPTYNIYLKNDAMKTKPLDNGGDIA